ncbi:sensor histidine kinase [Paenibacillus sp. NPDC058071]|uniref:sensor histidine kinase n=1 Tax=Paenibacillus sp. NPDC058071 TaxID=3346326 RepID=UPI0036D91384
MIKTLYVKVILAYLAVTALALVTSAYAVALSYQKYIINSENEKLIRNGQDIIRMYKEKGVEEVNFVMQGMPYFHTLLLHVYDQAGNHIYEGGRKGGEEHELDSSEFIDSILSGGIYRSSKQFLVGLPFDIEDRSLALVLESRPDDDLGYYDQVLNSMMWLALVIGTLLMGIAARYLVKPLLQMKRATESIAKGNFNISLKLGNRKDELGELAQSFLYMTQEIKTLENMRQEFVSNVSHEIQSPLTSITGFSKALQHQQMSEADRNRFLTIIQSESERLSRLCDNLLRLASLDNNSAPFSMEFYDLDEQIREIVLSLEPQWSEKEIDIDIKLPAIRVQANRDQLIQVWTNLIGNAIKFTPKDGKITITCKKRIDRVEIRIIDTGIGIAEEDLGRIFDRFFKSDRSRSKTKSGSGLGLAIVRKIILLHKGFIFVKSKPGEGTMFTVIIPDHPKERKDH